MWISEDDQRVFVSHADIRAAFAGTSFPAVITDEALQAVRVSPVQATQPPAFDPATHTAEQAAPVKAGAVWQQAWTVRTLTDDEVRAAALVAREQAKAQRAAAVAAIKVTTAAGNTFDGDELSQTRMARAIIALGTGLAPTVPWVLANNTAIDATAQELTEALALAGQAQAAMWVIA